MPRRDLNKGKHPSIHAVGVITLEWNRAEHELDMLIWHYLGDNYEIGRIVTSPLGSQTKTDMLLAAARLSETNTAVLARIEWGVRCFHICRENRNTIVHGYALSFDGPHWTLAKRSKGNPANWIGYRVRYGHIIAVARAISGVRAFIALIGDWVLRRRFRIGKQPLGPLPRKPALPKKLIPLPPESLTPDQRPP